MPPHGIAQLQQKHFCNPWEPCKGLAPLSRPLWEAMTPHPFRICKKILSHAQSTILGSCCHMACRNCEELLSVAMVQLQDPCSHTCPWPKRKGLLPHGMAQSQRKGCHMAWRISYEVLSHSSGRIARRGCHMLKAHLPKKRKTSCHIPTTQSKKSKRCHVPIRQSRRCCHVGAIPQKCCHMARRKRKEMRPHALAQETDIALSSQGHGAVVTPLLQRSCFTSPSQPLRG